MKEIILSLIQFWTDRLDNASFNDDIDGVFLARSRIIELEAELDIIMRN